MVKRILIPTDFSIESLNTLKYALKDNTIFELEVILLHAEFLSDSITDLLFYSKSTIIKSHINEGFEKALSVLENHFNEIKSLRFEILHYNKYEAMIQFLKTNKVDEIYIPKSYPLSLSKKSFNTLPLLQKSGFPLAEIDWKSTPGLSEQDHITNLFN